MVCQAMSGICLEECRSPCGISFQILLLDWGALSVKYKILLVVRWPVGGIRTFIRYVYRRFDKNLWDFTIIAPDLPEMQILLQEDLADLSIKYVYIPENPNAVAFLNAVFNEIASKNYALVHSHGFTAGIYSAFPSFIYKIKHIMTSHDVFNENQFIGFIGNVKKVVINIFFSLITKIHCVGSDAMDNLKKNLLFKNSSKLIVIENGIEVERFIYASPCDLRKKLNIGNHYYLVGFLGRFMAQKGFRYLIDAIEILSRKDGLSCIPLVLCFGEDGFVREERIEVKNRGLEHYFRFLPFASNVASVIKGLDVVIMPSLWEACALLPMETLVCGTPLVASNCIGLCEVIEGTPTIQVSPRNAVQIADAFERMSRTDMRDVFRSYASEAAQRFDVSRQADRLQQLYLELIAGKSV